MTIIFPIYVSKCRTCRTRTLHKSIKFHETLTKSQTVLVLQIHTHTIYNKMVHFYRITFNNVYKFLEYTEFHQIRDFSFLSFYITMNITVVCIMMFEILSKQGTRWFESIWSDSRSIELFDARLVCNIFNLSSTGIAHCFFLWYSRFVNGFQMGSKRISNNGTTKLYVTSSNGMYAIDNVRALGQKLG